MILTEIDQDVTSINAIRKRYTSEILFPNALIKKIQGKAFESIQELEKNINKLIENYQFRDAYIERGIDALGEEIFLAWKVGSEKRNLIKYVMKGKDLYADKIQIIGYLCPFTYMIIAGKPAIGNINMENGDNYFDISCTNCNKHIGRRYEKKVA